MKWMPITEAPKDGTVIDIWVERYSDNSSGRICDVKWVDPFLEAENGTNTSCFMAGWKTYPYTDNYTILNSDNFTHFMIVEAP